MPPVGSLDQLSDPSLATSVADGGSRPYAQDEINHQGRWHPLLRR